MLTIFSSSSSPYRLFCFVCLFLPPFFCKFVARKAEYLCPTLSLNPNRWGWTSKKAERKKYDGYPVYNSAHNHSWQEAKIILALLNFWDFEIVDFTYLRAAFPQTLSFIMQSFSPLHTYFFYSCLPIFRIIVLLFLSFFTRFVWTFSHNFIPLRCLVVANVALTKVSALLFA